MSTRPNHNFGINGTAYAVLPLTGTELSTIASLWSRQRTTYELSRDAHPKSVVAGIKQLFSENDTHYQLALNARLPLSNIRVPMDIRRDNVIGPLWMTWDIGPENISTTAGILDVLGRANAIGCTGTRSRAVPLSCDVDIYGRLMKL